MKTNDTRKAVNEFITERISPNSEIPILHR